MMNSLPDRCYTVSRVAIIAGSLMLSGCTSVTWFEPDRDFNNRWYGGAGVSASELEPDTSKVSDVSLDQTTDTGLSATVGYDFSDRISLEGHIADLGQASLSPRGAIDYQVAGVSGLVYGLNRTSNRSRREGFGAYGRLGLGTMSNSAEGVEYERLNDFHLLVGAGVEYGFFNGLAARAEFIAHEKDTRYAQLGLVYRFGGSQRSAAGRAPAVARPPSATSSGSAGGRTGTGSGSPVQAFPTPGNRSQVATVVDSDFDGIDNVDDLCPGTPAGLPVKANGCEVFNGVIEGITFNTGSADLTDGAIEVLSNVSSVLEEYPDIRVTIEAHTDNAGNAENNLHLSKRRAIAVARYLVEQGIEGSRLRPQAFGESNPRSSNATAEGRASNRRVEFSVLE